MEVIDEYPHRLVLKLLKDQPELSVTVEARKCCYDIIKYVEDQKKEAQKQIITNNVHQKKKESNSLKSGHIPAGIRQAFEKVKDDIADFCCIGAEQKDSSFWKLPEIFFDAFEKDSTALVSRLLHTVPMLDMSNMCCNRRVCLEQNDWPFFSIDFCSQARLKLVSSLRYVHNKENDGAADFVTDAARCHYEKLEFRPGPQACPEGASKQQQMTVWLACSRLFGYIYHAA